MMDCEWTNPGAAMLLSSTDDAHIIDQHILRQPVFPLYDLPSMFSPFPSQASPLDDYPLNRYGGGTGGGAATVPAAGQPMRIGLNLGVRTYFSSTPDGELMRLGSNIYRRCGGGTAATPGGVFSAMPSDGGRCGSAARCQAEGCAADLSRAKHYHRRHKVCEFHSKAASSLVHGLTQRFCQQCSRFHVVAEFDQGKRSCRKRLAEHNRRRRKTHHVATAKSSTEVAPPGKYGGALAAPPSPTRMALGRYAGANSATSSSLSQLGGASSCVSQGPHLDLGRRSLA